MRRVLKGLGNTFEKIGYHAERAAGRRREDALTHYAREMRYWVAFPAVLVGMIIPVFIAIDRQDFRMLPAIPPAVAAIITAYTALGARTPSRRFGRMLVAILLLGLTITVLALSVQPWWPISP